MCHINAPIRSQATTLPMAPNGMDQCCEYIQLPSTMKAMKAAHLHNAQRDKTVANQQK
jgi:hypothetical protein